jgi:hypothetical protein
MIFEKSENFSYLKSKAIFQIYIFLVYIVVSVVSFSSVDAGDDVCCEETIDEEFCVYTDEDNCKPGVSRAAVTCDKTNFCALGCCLDTDGGCTDNVGKANCENTLNSIYYGSFSCDKVGFCDEGCCEIGSNYRFITKRSCEVLIDENFPFLDVEDVWDGGIVNEEDCIYQAVEDDEGCCVKEGEYGFEGDCDWTVRGGCSTLGLEDSEGGPGFYKNVYCSNEGLQCDCVSNSYTGCDGEDVYWFDSCGNREELFEDCDYFGGTICREDGESASCESVNCEDTIDYVNNNHDPMMGEFRNNGESWCVYEGRVGPAMDLVGSRHYRMMCIDGEELIEPCRDFREEYCFQVVNVNGTGFNLAKCIENEGGDCVSCGSKSCCDEYNSCYWADGYCIPLISPGGLDVEFESSTPNYDVVDVCNNGDAKCTWVERKSMSGKWKCTGNCDCRGVDWANSMNEVCVAMGDCGAHYNVDGEWTKKGQSTSGKKVGKVSAIKPFAYYVVSGSILTISFAEFADFYSKHGEGQMQYAQGDWWSYGKAIGDGVYDALHAMESWGPVGQFLRGLISAIVGFIGGFFSSATFGIISVIITGGTAGKKRKHTVRLDCMPWVAPGGGDDCGKCNELSIDGICTEYKCRSLGKQCEMINADDPLRADCIKGEIDDVLPPAISPWREIIQDQGYDIDVLGSNCGGYEIVPKIESLKRTTIGIKTNEYARCRYDFNHSLNYYDMWNSFDQDYLSLEHNFTKVYPGGQDYTMFIRCIDKYDNGEDGCEYMIKFGTKNEPDYTAPIILDTSIPNGGSVAYGLNETPLILFMNEPIETCRWDKQDVDFEQMEINNSFFCGCYDAESNACTGTVNPGIGEELCEFLDGYGLFIEESFECVGMLQDIEQDKENKYYISCVDIKKEDETGCNINDNYEFKLKGSQALNIANVEPESGTYYYPEFVLRVLTTGGANDGISNCYYNNGYGPLEFFETGGKIHIQEQNVAKGNHEYFINCVDGIGNEANETISINIDADTNPPVVENLYSEGGILYLITDEESTCEYSVDEYFDIGEGFEMVGVMVESHSLVMVEDVYYIQCYDVFDNVGELVVVYNA